MKNDVCTMKEIDSIENKQLMLQILIYVDKICKENNLVYWIAYGTLLGAIRHKGFIPWDDDVDVLMPREDYEKFIQIVNKKNGKYKALHINNNKQYNYPFAKLINTETFCIEERNVLIDELGTFCDLFPMDGLGDDLEEAKIHAEDIRKCSRRVWQLYTVTFHDFGFKGMLLKMIGKRKLYKHMLKKCQEYSFEESKYVASPVSGEQEVLIYDKDIFCESVKVEFEKHQFNTLKNYDTFLKFNYGEYMELPPAEKRTGDHLLKVYKR